MPKKFSTNLVDFENAKILGKRTNTNITGVFRYFLRIVTFHLGASGHGITSRVGSGFCQNVVPPPGLGKFINSHSPHTIYSGRVSTERRISIYIFSQSSIVLLTFAPFPRREHTCDKRCCHFLGSLPSWAGSDRHSHASTASADRCPFCNLSSSDEPFSHNPTTIKHYYLRTAVTSMHRWFVCYHHDGLHIRIDLFILLPEHLP